ncbi:MAG: rod shape-determining protein MreC [Crocinitomicaceae bacterium]|nr:rod shape-determining protein MreC [Crocinitomicaceae bacterium]NGF74472.1 rod shape-determining protein MreC [Fluviicola sp. SGL-29]
MRNLIAFLRRFQIFLVFAILQVIALSFYFSFFYYPRSQYLTTTATVNAKIWEARNAVTKQLKLSHTNTELQKSNAELMKKLPQSFMRIDEDLVKINDTVYQQQYEYISAEVINSTVEKRNNYFTINVGSIHGVERGLGVISDNGVVGVVHRCSEHYSIVKSVLTENINISVVIEDMGLYGLLKWDGMDPRRGSVAGISNDLHIKKWSKVVTREGTGIFPKGIMVGKVEKLKNVEGEAFWDVSILFSEDYRKLQRVYVVKNLLATEQQKLERLIPRDPKE